MRAKIRVTKFNVTADNREYAERLGLLNDDEFDSDGEEKKESKKDADTMMHSFNACQGSQWLVVGCCCLLSIFSFPCIVL